MRILKDIIIPVLLTFAFIVYVNWIESLNLKKITCLEEALVISEQKNDTLHFELYKANAATRLDDCHITH